MFIRAPAFHCFEMFQKSFYVVLKQPIKCTISPEFGMTQIKLCTEEEDDSDSAEVLDVHGSDGNSRVLKVVARGRSGNTIRMESEWVKQIKKLAYLMQLRKIALNLSFA